MEKVSIFLVLACQKYEKNMHKNNCKKGRWIKNDYVICKLFFITLQYIYAVLCTCKAHYKQEICKCLEIVSYYMDICQCQNCTSDEEIEMEFKNDINMGYYN